MMNAAESFFIVGGVVLGSLLFVLLLNRFWQSASRREHNELIGWQISILGTTYAVILGFMLYTVWTDYQAADLNVDLEANSLLNISRLAQGLPEDQRGPMKDLARSYANAVIQSDWSEMAAGRVPEASHVVNEAMWEMAMSIKLATGPETIAEDHTLSELSDLAQHRRIRLLQSAARLPAVLWCVLIIGAALTIGSTCLFGSSSISFHALQVAAISLLLSLVLVAIADIRRPFQGAVHVSDYPFQRAVANMRPAR